MATLTVRTVQATDTRNTAYPVPYWEVDSGRPGPCLLVTAILHGTEVQGGAAVWRLLPEAARDLARGSLLLMPVCNPEAVRRRQPHVDFDPTRYYGSDTANNVNCSWPGRADGTNAERLADALYRQLLPRATHGFDVHAYSRIWAPIAYARTGHAESLAMARATGFPFGRHAEWRPEVQQRPVFPCTLSSLYNDTGRAGICVELSGQFGFWEDEVARGVRALRNVARLLGLLPGAPELPAAPMVWLNDSEQVPVPAPRAGLFLPAPLQPGDRVEAGAELGAVLGLADLEAVPVRAPAAGTLYQYGPIRGVSKHDMAKDPLTIMHPYAAAGETLAVLAVPRG